MKGYIKKINELQKELNDLHKRMKDCRNNDEYDMMLDEEQSIVFDIKFYADWIIRVCEIRTEMYNEGLVERVKRFGRVHSLTKMSEIREARKNAK